jgi:hypothetical protein
MLKHGIWLQSGRRVKECSDSVSMRDAFFILDGRQIRSKACVITKNRETLKLHFHNFVGLTHPQKCICININYLGVYINHTFGGALELH